MNTMIFASGRAAAIRPATRVEARYAGDRSPQIEPAGEGEWSPW